MVQLFLLTSHLVDPLCNLDKPPEVPPSGFYDLSENDDDDTGHGNTPANL